MQSLRPDKYTVLNFKCPHLDTCAEKCPRKCISFISSENRIDISNNNLFII